MRKGSYALHELLVFDAEVRKGVLQLLDTLELLVLAFGDDLLQELVELLVLLELVLLHLQLLALVLQLLLQVDDLLLLALDGFLLLGQFVLLDLAFVSVLGDDRDLLAHVLDHGLLFLFELVLAPLQLLRLLDDVLLLSGELLVCLAFFSLFLQETHCLEGTLALDDVGTHLVEVVVVDFGLGVLLDTLVDAPKELFDLCLLVDIHLETVILLFKLRRIYLVWN